MDKLLEIGVILRTNYLNLELLRKQITWNWLFCGQITWSQSYFGDKLLEIRVIVWTNYLKLECIFPQNGTAVLKGFSEELQKTKKMRSLSQHASWSSRPDARVLRPSTSATEKLLYTQPLYPINVVDAPTIYLWFCSTIRRTPRPKIPRTWVEVHLKKKKSVSGWGMELKAQAGEELQKKKRCTPTVACLFWVFRTGRVPR